MATKPTYLGKFMPANDPKTDKWIEVFVSDWFKEIFAFYAYIDLETYEQDINNIWDLVREFDYGGDIYIELIDHSSDDEMRKFYDWLYDKGYYTDSAALDPKMWKKYWNGGDKK